MFLEIISRKDGDIFGNLIHKADSQRMKQTVCSLILATDMKFHNSLMEDFKQLDWNTCFDTKEKEVFCHSYLYILYLPVSTEA